MKISLPHLSLSRTPKNHKKLTDNIRLSNNSDGNFDKFTETFFSKMSQFFDYKIESIKEELKANNYNSNITSIYGADRKKFRRGKQEKKLSEESVPEKEEQETKLIPQQRKNGIGSLEVE